MDRRNPPSSDLEVTAREPGAPEALALEPQVAEVRDPGEPLPPEPDLITSVAPEVVPYTQPEAQDDDTSPDELAAGAAGPQGAPGKSAGKAASGRRTPDQVVAWAKRQHDNGSSGWAGMCLRFSRMAADAPGRAYNAITAWGRVFAPGARLRPFLAPARSPRLTTPLRPPNRGPVLLRGLSGP